MTWHVIRAGPIGTSAEAIWHSRTGELTGDPAIVDRARRMNCVIARLGRGPRPIDWHDGATAVPAVLDAAGSVYGGPVDHYAIPEEGDPIFAAPALVGARRSEPRGGPLSPQPAVADPHPVCVESRSIDT